MIDFRYHIVSIVAVFLALALGLFLGSTTLQGVVFNDLSKRADRLEHDKSALVAQVDQLGAQVTAEHRYDDLLEPYAVQGRLSGQLVVIVSTPGVSGETRTHLMTTLEAAGATVTADVRLQSAIADPQQATFLTTLANRISIPGRTTPTGSGPERAAAQLADVLGIRPQARPVSDATIQTVLATYAAGNLVSVPPLRGATPRPGTLAIVLTPAGPATKTVSPAAFAEQTLVADLARDLDATSLGVVVAAPTAQAGAGSDIASVVASTLGSSVSTVHGIERSAGRVETVFALADEVSGKSGSYAVTPGATPLPTPTP